MRLTQLSGKTGTAAAIILCLAVSACQEQYTGGDVGLERTRRPERDIIGSIGVLDITLSDIQHTLALPLYDVEMQHYRLVRAALEARLLAELDAGDHERRVAEIQLQPPDPPRVEVVPDPARVRPGGDYPIEVLVFCNLESPHCTKLQAQLSHLQPMYEGFIQYADRDLILPFHRYGQLAAKAGDCARQQGRYWQYRDSMVAGTGAPDRGRVFSSARAAGLSMEAFAVCLASDDGAARLRTDSKLADELGLDFVPAVFVNGLYAGRNPETGHLMWLIEKELDRLGIVSPRSLDAVPQTREPLQPVALLPSTSPGLGLVALATTATATGVRFYREGDSLGTGLVVRRVLSDRVEILNHGIPEWFGLGHSPVGDESVNGKQPDSGDSDLARLEYPHQGVPVTLDRNEILVRMSDVASLEASLEPVPMKAGGFQLLRISDVQPGGLYEMLGLEPGDVITLVNEQPMHEGDKTLWQALQSEEEVRVRVVRKGGLAHHYTYRFAD